MFTYLKDCKNRQRGGRNKEVGGSGAETLKEGGGMPIFVGFCFPPPSFMVSDPRSCERLTVSNLDTKIQK